MHTAVAGCAFRSASARIPPAVHLHLFHSPRSRAQYQDSTSGLRQPSVWLPLLVVWATAAHLVATPESHLRARVVQSRKPSVLAVNGEQLLVDGRSVFLTGVSLFDALGRTPPRPKDFDALQTAGVRIVRVWAHWSEPVYRADGTLSARGTERLQALVRAIREREMLLELVLLRPGQLPGERYAAFSSPAARMTAVRSLTTALRGQPNILFDLYNEHDHPHGSISHREARSFRDLVKAIDPARLVTVSSTGGHLVAADGRLGPAELNNLREEAGIGDGAVGVDIVAPHLLRTADWDTQTAARVSAIKGTLRHLGLARPIYLNEEQRARPGIPLPADAYTRAVAGARSAGAAGWLLHTQAGFRLGERPFLEALTHEERTALNSLAAAAK